MWTHSRMELAFLKKNTNAHKYLAHFSHSEITSILVQYVPRLRSIQIFNSKIVPDEVRDEYHENVEKIVQEAREVLKFQLRSKIEKKIGDPHIARVYSSSF
jgi:hypothetical protein